MNRILPFAVALVTLAADLTAQGGPGAPPSQPPGQEQRVARLREADGALLALRTRTSEMLQLTLQAADPAALDQGLERVRLELEWVEERHLRLREALAAGLDAGTGARLREIDAIRAQQLARLQAMECDLCEPALERLRLQLRLSEELHLRLCEGLAASVPGETLERLRETHELRAQSRLQLRERECSLFLASLDPARLAERLREMEQLQLRLAEHYGALGQQLGAGAAGPP